MLIDEDIKKIIEVVATKEDIRELKEDISGLRESVQALTISIDKLVKAVGDLHQEFIAITAKVDRHEKWIHQIAQKLGIKLEY
jgi:uncharacterized coiled-coil DUF342 family protein